MFYLKEFLKIFRSNFLVSMLLCLSIFGAVTTALQKDIISQKLSLNAQSEIIPYFNALIHSGDGLESVRRKMKQLPGVRDIKFPKEKKISAEVSYLKENFDESLISELAVMNFKRIKVELDNGIEVKNQNLIKEYLLRLVGQDSVTIGSIKTPRKIEISNNKALFNITTWAESYLLIFFMVLFTICLILLKKPINNHSFIIEKFQRKKDVNTKLILVGCSAIFLLSLGANQLLTREMNIFVLIPAGYGLALMTILTFKKNLQFKL